MRLILAAIGGYVKTLLALVGGVVVIALIVAGVWSGVAKIDYLSVFKTWAALLNINL